ncbi:hypothetical protein P872_07625 [Rhodonellum psychrophilum GCM71 = DSM 17998]|uniref:Uncharacterized protein n=1 Tax=Rhodonellum psychrophilum GCM71 = DSM 17998 TaxID=1123057 RepID=U5BZC1_9BACT|nr:hypothetical protein P872_07625 [Rhodonellum psychrophilum GCM71 = DSM 17998]
MILTNNWTMTAWSLSISFKFLTRENLFFSDHKIFQKP